jgi:hypothetical protein
MTPIAGFCRFGDACRYSHADVTTLAETLPFHDRSFVSADEVGSTVLLPLIISWPATAVVGT